MPETDRPWKAAENAHAERNGVRNAHFEQTGQFALAALRAPALIAAGGIAACLGFYSANYERLSNTPGKLEIFNGVLFWLFLSLLATIVTPSLAYFSQLAYAAVIDREVRGYDYPYVQSTKASRNALYFGNTCRWGAVLSFIVSVVLLAIGGWHFLDLTR